MEKMKKEAGTSCVLVLPLLLVSLVLLPGCMNGFQEGNTTINRTYYDPFEIDQNALPKPLPPVENGWIAANEFAAAWSRHDHDVMYRLLDPFLQQYKTSDEFSAMMALSPKKYGARNVTVINVTVISYYQGKALFQLHRAAESQLLSMDMTYDQNETAMIYGFVDFFNSDLLTYVCGEEFNSTSFIDLQNKQNCLYELAYLSKSPYVCSTVPNVILDHGECFNIRDSANIPDYCGIYLNCLGVLTHVTGNSSLCDFPYDKDLKKCQDGVKVAKAFDQNKSLSVYAS